MALIIFLILSFITLLLTSIILLNELKKSNKTVKMLADELNQINDDFCMINVGDVYRLKIDYCTIDLKCIQKNPEMIQ